MENIENINENKSKKNKFLRIITPIIIALIILSLLYVNNKTFKTKVNNLLERLPGTAGEYFRNSPTDKERQIMKSELADYYLALEPDTAADKLYIIKKEDDKLYQDIIKLMNSTSSSKTAEIIELVRKIELRRDLLVSIYDEIQFEKESFLMGESERFQGKDLYIIINEIEKRFARDQEFKDNLPYIFSYMDENQAANILYYIDDSIKDEVLYSLNQGKRNNLENKIISKRAKEDRLKELAYLYDAKPNKLAIEEIGNTEKYSIEELAIIYKNMSILKSAEILSNIDNEEFVQKLFTAIKTEEQLLKEETITKEIGKSMEFISEYNDKVSNLVDIYEKMRPDKVAKIAEKMLNNDSTVTILEIQAEPVFKISDVSIMVDVLSRMNNKTLAKIMDNMNDRRASILTQELAKPIIRTDEIEVSKEDDTEIINNYNKKIDDLVSVYENMNPKKAAEIAKDMLNNNATTTIIVDIFSKIQDKNLSSIINEMDAKDASKLTQMLVR
jgi:flagellar motility protein MotE (MotC chaperone)